MVTRNGTAGMRLIAGQPDLAAGLGQDPDVGVGHAENVAEQRGVEVAGEAMAPADDRNAVMHPLAVQGIVVFAVIEFLSLSGTLNSEKQGRLMIIHPILFNKQMVLLSAHSADLRH